MSSDIKVKERFKGGVVGDAREGGIKPYTTSETLLNNEQYKELMKIVETNN